MKLFLISLFAVSASISLRSEDVTFEDLLARVSRRDPITKAILSVDKHRLFRLEQTGDQVAVTIWTHSKVVDPDKEFYTFPLSDVLRQELARLQFQHELNDLRARSLASEQRFRVSQYNLHPLRVGMTPDEVTERVPEAFRAEGRTGAELGALELETDTHRFVFRHGVLLDILRKQDSEAPEMETGR